MELIKNKKYRIEIVLGYNGNKKIRHIETFYRKRAKPRQRNLNLRNY